MEVIRPRVEPAPDGSGRIRLAAEVAYDDGEQPPETYWFEYPAHVSDAISTTGNLWLACLLPLAATRGEPLRLPLAVSPRLLEGARQVIEIWNSWYPDVGRTEVVTGPDPAPRTVGDREGVFFSGGVDSFFTVLHDPAPPSRDLITVVGLDVPLRRQEAADRLTRRHMDVARSLDAGFIEVRTNVRETRWQEADWERLAHGPVLAAIGLGIERRFRAVRIAAGSGYRDLRPWGSHPLVDPLWSTEGLEVIHDGGAFSRVEKMRRLVGSGLALESLRICWRSGADENCGRCNKCYRAMLTLDLLGALAQATTLPGTAVDRRRVARLFCMRSWEFRDLMDIRELALEAGRADLARAASRAVRGTRRRQALLGLLRGVGERHTWSRRLTRRVEERLLERWIP